VKKNHSKTPLFCIKNDSKKRIKNDSNLGAPKIGSRPKFLSVVQWFGSKLAA
jgi:hypothetical protein